MNQSEESLVKGGLSPYEAKIVVYLARHREADSGALAQTIQASEEHCQTILKSMQNRGILKCKKTLKGEMFSLSSFLTDTSVNDEKHQGGKPFFPPFKASKISRIVKPTPE